MRFVTLFFCAALGVTAVAFATPCADIIERRSPLIELTPNSLIDTKSVATLRFEDSLPFAAQLDAPVLTRSGTVFHILQTGVGSYAQPSPTCVAQALSAGTTSASGSYRIEWDYRLTMNDGTTFTAQRLGFTALDRMPPVVTILPRSPRTSSPIVISVTAMFGIASDAVQRTVINGSRINLTIDSYEGPVELTGSYFKQVSIPPLPSGRYDVEVTVRHLWFDGVCCYYATDHDRRVVTFFVTVDPAVPDSPRRRVAGH